MRRKPPANCYSPSLTPPRPSSTLPISVEALPGSNLPSPACHGPMRILAAIHPPETTRKILEHLGLPSRAPPVAGPRIDDDPFPDDAASDDFDFTLTSPV